MNFKTKISLKGRPFHHISEKSPLIRMLKFGMHDARKTFNQSLQGFWRSYALKLSICVHRPAIEYISSRLFTETM